MKNNTLLQKFGMRFVAVTTVMALMTGSLVGCTAKEAESVVATEEVIENTVAQDTLQSVMETQVGVVNRTSDTTGKEEIVYIFADANGNTNNVIVSDWLKNGDSEDTIKDTSSLSDIVNVSGDEAYVVNADGEIEWNANGNDIHYQGTTDAKPPVDVKITYFLDDKEISPQDLVGKSGKVKIRFDYTNNEKKTVTIGEEEKEIYVPFTMVSGVMLDVNRFSNIEVTNGRVLSTGNANLVVGMAFPGLSDSINMEKVDETKIPDCVEITANVEDFQMEQTMTMAFSDVLSSINLDSELDIDTTEITDSVDELSDASTKLANGTSDLFDGTGKLKDGAKTLAEKSIELDDGAKQLDDGASKLTSGADELANGAGKLDSGAGDLKDGINQVDSGVDRLNAGASTLNDGAGKLNAGAKQLADGTGALKTGADDLVTGLGTLEGGATSLEGGAAQLEAGAGNLKDGITQYKAGVSNAKSGAAQVAGGLSQVESGLAAQQSSIEQLKGASDQLNSLLSSDSASVSISTSDMHNMLQSNMDAAQSAVNAAQSAYDNAVAARNAVPEGEDPTAADNAVAAAQSALDNANAAYSAAAGAYNQFTAIEAQLGSTYDITAQAQQLASGISGGLDTLNTSIYGAGGLQTSVQQLSQGASQVSEGLGTLETKAGELEAGAGSIKDGATNLKAGAGQLKGGASQAVAGANQLSAGAGQLSSGASELYNGTISLKDGALELSNGTKTLKDGTSKLASGAATLKDGTAQLANGTLTLKSGTIDLKAGTRKLADGTSQFKDGTAELYDGTLTLSDGSKELMEGMFKFKEEGIDKLTDLFGDNVENALDTLSAIMDAGSEYNTFAGAESDINSSVKFIYKTDAVK